RTFSVAFVPATVIGLTKTARAFGSAPAARPAAGTTATATTHAATTRKAFTEHPLVESRTRFGLCGIVGQARRRTRQASALRTSQPTTSFADGVSAVAPTANEKSRTSEPSAHSTVTIAITARRFARAARLRSSS